MEGEIRMRALFVVNEVLERKDREGGTMGIILKMNPSYETGVNKAFWQATPTGHLEMQINNPAVYGVFHPGQKFWLDFTLFADSLLTPAAETKLDTSRAPDRRTRPDGFA